MFGNLVAQFFWICVNRENFVGMGAVFQLLAILLTINLTWAAASLLDKIKDDPDLSQVSFVIYEEEEKTV